MQDQPAEGDRPLAKCVHCCSTLDAYGARVCSKCRLGQGKLLSFYDHRMNFVFAMVGLLIGGGQTYLASQRAASAELAMNQAETAARSAASVLAEVQRLRNDISAQERSLSAISSRQDQEAEIARLVDRSLNDDRRSFDLLVALARRSGPGKIAASSGLTVIRQKYVFDHLDPVLDPRAADAARLAKIADPCKLIDELKGVTNSANRLLIVRLLLEKFRSVEEVQEILLHTLKTDGSLRVCATIVSIFGMGQFEGTLVDFEEFSRQWPKFASSPAHGISKRAGCKS